MRVLEIKDMDYAEVEAFFGPEIPIHVVVAAQREGMPKYRYGTRVKLTAGHVSQHREFTVTQMFWCQVARSWVYYVPGIDAVIPVYHCESDLKEIK